MSLKGILENQTDSVKAEDEILYFRGINTCRIKTFWMRYKIMVELNIIIIEESCYTYTLQTKGLIYNKFYGSSTDDPA